MFADLFYGEVPNGRLRGGFDLHNKLISARRNKLTSAPDSGDSAREAGQFPGRPPIPSGEGSRSDACRGSRTHASRAARQERLPAAGHEGMGTSRVRRTGALGTALPGIRRSGVFAPTISATGLTRTGASPPSSRCRSTRAIGPSRANCASALRRVATTSPFCRMARLCRARGPVDDARHHRHRGTGRDAGVQSARGPGGVLGQVLQPESRRCTHGARPRSRCPGRASPSSCRRSQHRSRAPRRRVPGHGPNADRERHRRRHARGRLHRSRERPIRGASAHPQSQPRGFTRCPSHPPHVGDDAGPYFRTLSPRAGAPGRCHRSFETTSRMST